MAVWYHRLSWKILQMSYCIYLKKIYRVELLSCPEEPEPPYIFLANHAHRADPFILGMFAKTAMNYVANVGAVSTIKRIGGRLVGVIPKTKGRPDFAAVKRVFRLLRAGNIVGIFAEGDRSWDGETDRIIENIPQLIKKADTPLRLARLVGNYLSMPRWATTKRRGKIFVEFTNLTRDEIHTMANTELRDRIFSILYRNDVKDEKMQSVVFKGKYLASGIQFLLWLCPTCHAHDSIYGRGDEIICTSCGEKWGIDGNLRITPCNNTVADLKDWSDWQKREIKRMCLQDKEEPITISNNVEMTIVKKNETKFSGNGKMTLFKDRVVFLPYRDDNAIIFNIDSINYYIDNFNKSFHFIYRGSQIKINFKGKNACKWIYLFRCLHGYLV